jgi:hypothetical protein
MIIGAIFGSVFGGLNIPSLLNAAQQSGSIINQTQINDLENTTQSSMNQMYIHAISLMVAELKALTQIHF